MKTRSFNRVVAAMLCFALLLPNFIGVVTAAGSASAAPQAVLTNTKWVPVSDPFAAGEIPAFDTKGKVTPNALVMDCGNGVTNDAAKSYMKMVTGASASETVTYASKLQNAGFTRTAYQVRKADAAGNNNIFYRYLSPNKNYVLTVYYLHAYKEVRIIADTAEDIVKTYSTGFTYVSQTNETAQTALVMYGLSMSQNGYDGQLTTSAYNDDNKRNCGALMVIRMPDNSLFINDGGDVQQWSDEACADFMTFCRELTGKKEGEKVVINSWFVSHTHSDHYNGIPRFFAKYHDQIDIKNFLYNIDDERSGSTRDMTPILRVLKGYFPDATYYKPHTGESFDIMGVHFDVLYTQEDRFIPDANNSLNIGDLTLKTSDGGTYRDFLYSDAEKKQSDYNDTSTVLRVTFPENITGSKKVTSNFYADLNLGDQIMWEIWPAEMLVNDIMMVPHHGHDPHPELVAMSNASIFLYTQAKSAIYGPNGIVDEDVDQAGTYRPKLVGYFQQMNDQDANGDGKPDNYFSTTADHKTYWEGTETACILFGEGTSFQNKPTGLTLDSESPNGFTVYTAEAKQFAYTGWSVIPNLFAGDSTTTSSVTTGTRLFPLVGVTLDNDKTDDNILSAGSMYAIVHDKTNQLMSYEVLKSTSEDPALAESIKVGFRDQALAGEVNAEYCVTSGAPDDSQIFISHDRRSAVLWELSFTSPIDGSPVKYNNGTPKFSSITNEFFNRSVWIKGTRSAQYPFWDLTESTVEGAFRYLQPNVASIAGSEIADGVGSLNIRVEFFDETDGAVRADGLVEHTDTCVIYYSNDTQYRFLTVDSEGNWIRKVYKISNYSSASACITAIKNDLDDLKLRLYRYDPQDTYSYKTVAMEGSTAYKVLKGMAAETLANEISSMIRVMDTSRSNLPIAYSGTTPAVGYYWLDMSSYNGTSSCTVAVKYRNDNGTDTTLAHLTIQMQDYYEMYAAYNDDDTVYAGTAYGSKYGFMYLDEGVIYEEVVNHANRMDMLVSVHDAVNGVVTSTINITPDMLTYANGNSVNFNLPGEYNNLSLVYDGKVVDTGFNIRVTATAEDLSYPEYDQPGSVVVNKQGITPPRNFMATGIANIQLSTTAIPEEKGVDLILVMDLSGSMKNGLDTNVDAPKGQQRIDAMEASLKEIIRQLQNSGADVRIAMSDFGDNDHYTFGNSVSDESVRERSYYDITLSTSFNNDPDKDNSIEFYNHLNWVISDNDYHSGAFALVGHKFNQAHSQYTGIVTPEVYTGSKVLNANAFVDVNSLTTDVMDGIIAKMDKNVNHALGTNYDVGLEYAYRLGYAIRQDNKAHGEDRDVVCIFMSDGAAIQYNYFSGNAQSSGWSEYLMGIPQSITSTSEYYADQGNWPKEIEEISQTMLELLVSKESAGSSYSQLKAPLYRNQSISSRYPEFNDRYFVYRPDLTRATAKYFYTYMDDQGYQLYDWEFLYRLAKANGYEEYIGQEFTPEYYHSSEEHKVLQYLVDLLTTPRGDPIYQTDAEGNPVYKTDANGNIVYKEDENGVLQPVQVMYFQSQLQNPYYRNAANYSETNPDHADELLVAAPKFYKQSNLVIDASKSYTDQFFAAMEAIGVPCDWSLYARLAEVNKASIQTKFGYEKPRDMLKNLIHSVKTPVAGYGDYQTLSPYDYFYNTEGKNWWAEAMKGDSDTLYPVINKYAYEHNAAWSNAYYGDVRNNFSTGTGLALDGQDYISGFVGLDMELYTVSFSISDDRLLTTEVAETVLKNVASGPNYFYSASTQDDLTEVLQIITSTMSTSATRAWFTDTMGPDFDLSTEKTVLSHDGTLVTVNPNPSIRVMEYDVEIVTDANGKKTYQRVGNPRIVETVTFEDLDGDGDVDAWSDQVYTTSEVDGVVIHNKVDIWDESTGLISGKNFYYNANTDKNVNIAFGSQGSYPLAPETFFWVIGVIGQTEMVLDYQVYLTGSIEGDRLLTSEDYYHATNTNAVLHYINYLGQDATRDTISPEYPWGDGKVGYGYYLVNKNGQIIANQATGATTTDFTKAIKLTQPIYEYLLWNADYSVASGGVTAAQHRPEGYTLYSPNAAYNVTMGMDGSGKCNITDAKNSTYVVTQSGAYNASQSYGAGAYQTGQTVVWFAVVVDQFSTAPDTVVIDYGLSVDIDVLGNDHDAIGRCGTIAAFGPYSTNVAFSGIILNQGYAAGEYTGTYGKASVENNKVHYQLSSMVMNGAEQFNYAVYYTPTFGETGLNGYYYNSVTVIPATSIYFEDDFVQYHTYKYDNASGKYVVSNENKWTLAKDENFDSLQGAHQDEDRPGSATLPEIDADNIYGFDSAYAGCSKYSLGSAMKFTANATYGGTMTFSFYGTGFDVVSLTSSDTGTIMVDVYQAEGYVQDQSKPLHTYMVDTYYGYTYDKANQKWIVTPGSDALYQVPVMKVGGLDYGHYIAVITAAYSPIFDHKTADSSYDFYLDAIRIYDPAGKSVSQDTLIGGAYGQDGEFDPSYEELRNILLTERNFYDSTAQLGEGYFPGAVFIDGIPMLNDDNYDASFKKDPPQIGTYMNYGPNNEVYLAPGQAIAFDLNKPEDMQAAHLALKSTYGSAKIKIFRAGTNMVGVNTMTIDTATDRYYDLTELAGDTVIIVNVGTTADGILSITNLKVTTKTGAAQQVDAKRVFTMSRRSAQRAVDTLSVGFIPETGDAQMELMFSLALLACLSAMAVLVLIYMQKVSVKKKKSYCGGSER